MAATMNAKRKPQAPKPPVPTEYELHLSVAKYLNHALTGNCFWFHSPNGGLRTASEAGRFKKMGVTPGLPDIGVIDTGRIAWLELKRAKGSTTSPAQHYCHEQLRRARSPVYVCKNLDDVEAALKDAGIPVKARTL
jgi:hypothetical protein